MQFMIFIMLSNIKYPQDTGRKLNVYKTIRFWTYSECLIYIQFKSCVQGGGGGYREKKIVVLTQLLQYLQLRCKAKQPVVYYIMWLRKNKGFLSTVLFQNARSYGPRLASTNDYGK